MDKGLALLVRQYHHGQHEEGGRGLGLSRQIRNDPYLHHPDDLSLSTDINNDSDNRNIDQDETFLTPKLAYKTVVAPDDEVTNGFVKDKRFLPYVFEANEEGMRKQSSKVLPICGVCGKDFVCVTTMKRHMVTHTGEKPFSCKVCGKQYTQKGNLRVHERTHRNDRPFVCSICSQKFYRKEPMQKHQRRQHGMVSLKSGGTTRKETPQTNATDISMKSLLTAVAKVESASTNRIQCAGCRTPFHQEQDLIAHLVISSETLRPFNCCICNCRFSQLVYLTKHQVRVHSGKVEDENDDEVELESGPLNLNKQQFVASSKDPAEDNLPLDLSPSKKGISGNLNRRYSSILKDGSANDQPLAKKPRLRLSPNLLTSMPFLQKSEALDDPLSDIRNLPYYRHVLK